MSKELLERLDAADLRIDRTINLAGAIAARDAVSQDLEEFLTEQEDIIERCLGPLPSWLVEELDTGSAGDAVTEWLWESRKYGWLLWVTTPVMTHDATGSTFSWGYCNSHWTYGDTFDEAVEKALTWVAERRAAERAKNEKSKARRPRSKKS